MSGARYDPVVSDFLYYYCTTEFSVHDIDILRAATSPVLCHGAGLSLRLTGLLKSGISASGWKG